MEEPLSWITFRDVTWLQQFQLTSESVFIYLGLSQFYDRTCNNEVLRMQTRFTAEANADHSQKLLSMVGTEYALITAKAPEYFLLHKRQRSSPSSTALLAVIFVLNGTIYLAPSLHALLTYRINSLTDHLNAAWLYANEWCKPDLFTGKYRISTPDSDDSKLHPEDEAAVRDMTSINTAFLSVINKLA